MLLSLWRNRYLILQMTHREVIGRYRGSIIGVFWSLLTPIFMLVIYTFVFSVVFKARWGNQMDESHGQFATILFVGLIVHGVFSEALNKAPHLILMHVNYVKKVVFPLEILPVVHLLVAGFNAIVSLFVLLCAQLLITHNIYWTVFLIPFIAVPLFLFTLGMCWFFASLGVFLRDLGQAISLITSVMLFTSPVFFPVHAIPEKFRPWMQLNPLTFIIEQARDVLIFGRLPNWYGLLAYSFVAFFVALAGFKWFQKTRKGFSDVL